MVNTFEIIAISVIAKNILPVTKVYYLVFAALTIVGGIMGYVKAKSVVSIISGTISGLILIFASSQLPGRPILAGVVGLIVSVLLAGKFVPDFVHKKAFVPGGLMAFLSVVSIIVTILALLPK